MTLNGVIALILRYFAEFGSFGGRLKIDRWLKIEMSPTKMYPKKSSFYRAAWNADAV